MKRIVSARATKRIDELFALIVTDATGEGVLRRDTPWGTQPWITDDERLVPAMRAQAEKDHRVPEALRACISVARFIRVKS